mgnify:CR=1 FL=1
MATLSEILGGNRNFSPDPLLGYPRAAEDQSTLSNLRSAEKTAQGRIDEAQLALRAFETQPKRSEQAAKKIEKVIGERSELLKEKLPEMKEVNRPIPPDVRMPLDKLFMMIATAAFASSAAGKKNYMAAAAGLTGALEGIQKGQKEAAATALKQYDQAMKAALNEDQRNLQKYRAIMDQRNKTLQQKQHEFEAAVREEGNYLRAEQSQKQGLERTYSDAIRQHDTLVRDLARHEKDVRLAAERAQEAREREQRRAQQAKEMAEIRKKGDTQRATQQTFIVQRAVNALGGVASALESIVEAPVGATTGWLPNLQTKDGMFNAIRNQIGRSVTEPEAEFMNTLFSGIGRNLASIEASGTATGLTALANQLQSGVYINAGVDDPYKVAIKLADIRRIATENIRPAIDSGIMPPQQAKAAENLIDRIEKVIPYTTKDVIQAYNEAQGKPSATLGQSARKAATGVTGTTKTPTPEEINRALQRIRELEGKQ